MLITRSLLCRNPIFVRSKLSEACVNRQTFRDICIIPPRLSSKIVTQTETESKDVFGDVPLPVTEKIAFNKFDFEPDDNDAQDEHDAKIGDILRPGREQFLRKINHLVHQKRNLAAALNVLETEMKEECVKPEQAHYRILIHACAKVGHTKKAFDLFRSFRKRGLKRHVGIYSDLFHSCAMSSDAQLALANANWLRKHLAAEHFIPSAVLYHSMIQAFGRAGDLETAFELIDEMRKNAIGVTHETFDFLLQGCISDKEHGFRHALLTWRLMRAKKVWPRIHNYNLMLKAAQDCKLGDVKYSKDIISACLPSPQSNKSQSRIEERREESQGSEDHSTSDLVVHQQVPNLLSKRPSVNENIIGLTPRDTPQSRLMLMGGTSGLLDLMMKDRASPNIKTFDQLLRLIPNTKEEEMMLLEAMRELKVKPDVSFCNQLIIQRGLRGDVNTVGEVLDMMHEMEFQPDIMTFGALARCCNTPAKVKTFIRDLKALNTKPNVEIMTSLIKNMAIQLNVDTVQYLLYICQKEQVKVNKRMLNTVEKFFQTYRGHVKAAEHGKRVPKTVRTEFENGLEKWEKFQEFYHQWLGQVKPDMSDNPLDHYKTIKDVKDEEYRARNP